MLYRRTILDEHKLGHFKLIIAGMYYRGSFFFVIWRISNFLKKSLPVPIVWKKKKTISACDSYSTQSRGWSNDIASSICIRNLSVERVSSDGQLQKKLKYKHL